MDEYESKVPVTRESFNEENDIAIFMGPLTSMYGRIRAQELKTLMKDGRKLSIIDVRAPEEYRSGHICGAAEVPVESIEERVQGLDTDRLIVVYCGAPMSAEGIVAADKLHTLSFHNVLVLDGGLSVWKKEGGCLELETSPALH
jgi:rhodanese-related sulfurtransferase